MEFALVWCCVSLTCFLVLLGPLVALLLICATRKCPCGSWVRFQDYEGMECTEVFEDVTDGKGVRVVGYWTPSKEAFAPMVIVTHGHSKSVLKKGKGGYTLVDKLASPLHKSGFSILSVDLRNHGQSAYCPPVSLGVLESYDIIAAHEWLLRRGINAENIGLAGTSMGASTVLIASARLGEKVKAVVADSPFASFDATFQQWLAHKVGGRCSSCLWRYLRCWIAFLMKCFTSHDLSETDVVAAVKRSKAHIFHSHGTSDEVVPFENSSLLAKAARERSLRIFVLQTYLGPH